MLTLDQGVFLNGVDQGTFRGIRTPAYNGAPPSGYANSPVKDLNSIDMRCNVLGDKQNAYTIQVEPGDNLTFDCTILSRLSFLRDLPAPCRLRTRLTKHDRASRQAH
jgi:hypothetical protein